MKSKRNIIFLSVLLTIFFCALIALAVYFGVDAKNRNERNLQSGVELSTTNLEKVGDDYFLTFSDGNYIEPINTSNEITAKFPKIVVDGNSEDAYIRLKFQLIGYNEEGESFDITDRASELFINPLKLNEAYKEFDGYYYLTNGGFPCEEDLKILEKGIRANRIFDAPDLTLTTAEDITSIVNDGFTKFAYKINYEYINAEKLDKADWHLMRVMVVGENDCEKVNFITYSPKKEYLRGENAVYEFNFRIVDEDHTASIEQRQIEAAEAENIIIPDLIKFGENKYLVNEISYNAFEKRKLVSISLPESIERIMYAAFYDCQNLKEINIPNSLNKMQTGAFYNTALESIKLPDLLTEIPIQAFAECKMLKKVELGENVTTIRNEAFQNCANLTEINLPNSITLIAEYCFDGTGIVELHIPEKLLFLPDDTFTNLCNLEKVYIPAELISIGNNLTSDKLKEFIVDEDNSFFTALNNGRCLVGNYANVDNHSKSLIRFAPNGITSYDIPLTITEIDSHAFHGNKNIRSITLTDDVTTIRTSAFAECSNLKTIKLSKNISYLPSYVFNNCTSLETVIFPEDSVLTKIESYAFENCTSLSEITLPSSVRDLDTGAFSSCTSLKTVKLNEGLTTISNSVFEDCVALENITIPSTVRYFNSNFNNCPALQSVTILCETRPSGEFITGERTEELTYKIYVPAGKKELYSQTPLYDYIEELN